MAAPHRWQDHFLIPPSPPFSEGGTGLVDGKESSSKETTGFACNVESGLTTGGVNHPLKKGVGGGF